jgi:uncharacterized Ntn-hydrolase superfamily protein
LYVVRPAAGYGGFNDVWIDYRVDDHPDPVVRLGELLDLHRLYFGKSAPEEEVPVSGEVARELQGLMGRLGYYRGAPTGVYDDPTREAFRRFIGNENFEDRTNFEIGRIDLPVLEFLRRKFAG